MLPELGKYAAEVISAYGVSIAMLLALVVLTLRRGRRARATLRLAEQEAKRDG